MCQVFIPNVIILYTYLCIVYETHVTIINHFNTYIIFNLVCTCICKRICKTNHSTALVKTTEGIIFDTYSYQ